MRHALVIALALVVSAACGGRVAIPSPAATPGPDRLQVFYARPAGPPLPAPIFVAPGLPIDARLRVRFDTLSSKPLILPDMSINVLHDAAPVSTVAVERDLATIDFRVEQQDWGLHDSSSVRAFVQQVVFTATDERSIYRVRLTQNGGRTAVIAVEDMIVTYPVPLTRELVAPDARPDHTVAYFVSDHEVPSAVFLEGAGIGATAEERIRSRLVALENGPVSVVGAFNVAARMKARLASVEVRGDLAIVDYRVPGDDWGVNGSASLRALVLQLVFTASEEPGIARVMITQNGGTGAVISGEGLIVDRPQTRWGRLAARRGVRRGDLVATGSARVEEKSGGELPRDHGEAHGDRHAEQRDQNESEIEAHDRGIVRPAADAQ